jgi:4-amino-4-deoxy-L-arabinose transferase-like glycosyltransferase
VTRRRLILGYAIITLIAVMRVAKTHHVFAATSDEPVHLISGFDWLHGKDLDDLSHPPLARIVAALPAYFERLGPFEGDPVGRANALLYAKGAYRHNVSAARRPLLIFVVLGIIATGLWTARYFGDTAGLLAAAFFSTLPPLLGSAGLFTTDFAIAAVMPLAWLLLERFLDEPTTGRALAAGLAIGAAAIAKFSFLLFFPVSAIVLIAARWPTARPRFRVAQTALVCLTAFMVVWATYRFEFKTLRVAAQAKVATAEVFLPRSMLQKGLWIDRTIPFPAPLYIVGAGIVKLHNDTGHLAFLLGDVRMKGWWYYFPVVFFFKTPLPFLALMTVGIVLIATRRRDALPLALIPIALMISVLPSHINIGIRHILPIYPPLCAVAAYGTLVLWRNAATRGGAAALVAWLFAGVALAHPDYLAWFNEAAGPHPEHIAIDSNIDWGQDALRLVAAVRRHHIPNLRVVYTGSLMLHMHGVHADTALPFVPEPGWYALSLTSLELDPDARNGGYRWLDDYHYEMVGKSIRLYHVPLLPNAVPFDTNPAAATSASAPKM